MKKMMGLLISGLLVSSAAMAEIYIGQDKDGKMIVSKDRLEIAFNDQIVPLLVISEDQDGVMHVDGLEKLTIDDLTYPCGENLRCPKQ